MRLHVFTLIVIAAVAAGCAGGPAPLAYGLPGETVTTYARGDTLTVEINALGQSLQLGVQSVATFGVDFESVPEGLRVTMRVEELAAELNAPLAGPVQVDESVVSGDLVFLLDRRGAARVVSAPDVGGAAGLFSATSIANGFFPRLPARAVSAGDTWTDTISYREDSDAGGGSQTTILEYTAVGDTEVEGRSLLEITFVGTSESDQVMDLQGTEVHQMTESELRGRVLWDVQRGLMFESETVSSGTGTVEVSVVPGQLPTTVRVVSRARLRS